MKDQTIGALEALAYIQADWTFRGSVNGSPCKHIMVAWLRAHRKGPEA